jgi:hypothetical protein
MHTSIVCPNRAENQAGSRSTPAPSKERFSSPLERRGFQAILGINAFGCFAKLNTNARLLYRRVPNR